MTEQTLKVLHNHISRVLGLIFTILVDVLDHLNKYSPDVCNCSDLGPCPCTFVSVFKYT